MKTNFIKEFKTGILILSVWIILFLFLTYVRVSPYVQIGGY